MKLKKWMKENDISVTAMAIKLNMEKSTVYKFMQGTRRPSLPTALKIEKATGGEVTPSDMAKNVNS